MRFQLDDGIVVEAERVARLEERFDNVAAAIADLKAEVGNLDDRIVELRSEMRGEFSAIRSEFGGEFGTQGSWQDALVKTSRRRAYQARLTESRTPWTLASRA